MLYSHGDSSLILTKSFVLNLDCWFGVLSNKFLFFFFHIPWLYYYINLGLSIIFCLSSRDIYLSLGIYLSCLFVNVSELFCCKYFETPVIRNFITNQITTSISIINNFMPFFWRYISFFGYFLGISLSRSLVAVSELFY